MGYRTEDGFIGEHDRITGEPIPEHVSARWQDVQTLMEGLLNTAIKIEKDNFSCIISYIRAN